MKRLLKVLGSIVIGILILSVVYIMAGRFINGQKSKITTAKGIQENVMIDINGMSQVLSIRGEDIDNPIILFIHGGPGVPTGCFDYLWQPELNKNFTIVTFEQRGCAKTFYNNPEAEVSKELILQDIDTIVDYLRQRFNQDKVIIMGHSWGTILGTEYTYARPEKVKSYIGVGQVVNMSEGEQVAAQEAMKRATAQNDEEYIEVFKENYDAFCSTHKIDESFMTYRSMEPKYLKGDKEKTMLQLASAYLTSPILTFQDAKWFLIDSNKSLLDENNTLTKGLFDFNGHEMRAYEVPMYFISGGNDYVTPFALAEKYCEEITAPDKAIKIIEGAGHNTYLDVPGEFSAAVEELLNRQ